MNAPTDLPATCVKTDLPKSSSSLAWRSIAISVAITVIAVILYVIAVANYAMRMIGSVYSNPWFDTIFESLAYYGFGIPICSGAFYLALKVRAKWIKHATIYIAIFFLIALAFFLIVRIPFGDAWEFFRPIVFSYPFVLLMRLPAKFLIQRFTFFKRSSDEKLVFGISSMLWGSTIVALLIFLVLWTIDYGKQAAAKHSLTFLVTLGATYDESRHHLTIRPDRYSSQPFQYFQLLSVDQLKKKVSIEFVDCEITDETVAYLKQMRSGFNKIQFTNCKVVKETSPTGLVIIGNELNEPLPNEMQ